MRRWNQYRLIDILCGIDPACLEEEIPESDLERLEDCSLPEDSELAQRKVRRRRIALISGLAAAGSVAITSVAVLAFRKRDMIKKAA